MTYIERGLYRELLDECWAEGFIVDDINAMADICGCPVEVMANAWQVLSKCFVLLDGVWVNERMEQERTEKDAIRVKRAMAGKVGGLHKSLNEEDNLANAKQMLANASKCHIEEKRREEKSKEEKYCPTGVEQALNRRSTNRKPITDNHKPIIKPLSACADVVVTVFDHWRSRMRHPAAKLDNKRRRLITTALKIGYTPENLCAAIDGCALSPHHMGQNDRSTRYDSLDLILRNADKIDWFIAMTEQNQGFVDKHTDRSWRDGIDGPTANAEAEIERDPSVVATMVAGGSENAKQGAL